MDLDNAVSEIFMKTTDFEPKLNLETLHYVMEIDGMNISSNSEGNVFEDDYYEYYDIFCTGSVAELRLKPMLSCYGDIDVMYHLKDEEGERAVGIQRGERVNWSEKRSKEIASAVKLYDIQSDLEYPGYVTLDGTADLFVDSKASQYADLRHDSIDPTIPFSGIHYFSKPDGISHGPASQVSGIINISDSITIINPKIDLVRSVQCLGWPSEAEVFVTREKSSGWPTENIIKAIVDSGYDVVQVHHPDYKGNPEKQWRISFSRAEIILIRSLTNVQQLIYHLLRYFMKHILQENIDILSNYHIKTLLLWTCEQQPSSEWNSSRLMGILSDFIRGLVRCMRNRKLSHYFIENCNLFRTPKRYDEVIHNLKPYRNTNKLSEWFLHEYIVRAFKVNIHPDTETAHSLTDYLQSRIEDLARATDNEKYLLMKSLGTEFIEMSDSRKCYQLFHEISSAVQMLLIPLSSIEETNMTTRLLLTEMTRERCKFYLRNLNEVDDRLKDFFRAICYLSSANRLQKRKYVDHKFLDFALYLVSSLSIGVDETVFFNEFQYESKLCYFDKSISLLRMHKSSCTGQFKETLLELGKLCLIKASESSNPLENLLANVYLSVFSYGVKQCAPILRNSLVALKEEDINEGPRIDTKLLPKIEGIEIATGFGLILLYVLEDINMVEIYKGFIPLFKHIFEKSGQLDKITVASVILLDMPVTFSPYVVSQFLLFEELRSKENANNSQMIRDQLMSVKVDCYNYLRLMPFRPLRSYDWCLFGVLVSNIRKSSNCCLIHHGILSLDEMKINDCVKSTSFPDNNILHHLSIGRQSSNLPIEDDESHFWKTISDECNKKLTEFFIDSSIRHLTEWLLIYSRVPQLSRFNIFPHQYEALNYLRSKQFQRAIEICDDIRRQYLELIHASFSSENQFLHTISTISSVIVSLPFNVLLDEHLRTIVNEKVLSHHLTGDQEVILIHPIAIVLYVKIQCLLELGKSGVELDETLVDINSWMSNRPRESGDESDILAFDILSLVRDRAVGVYSFENSESEIN